MAGGSVSIFDLELGAGISTGYFEIKLILILLNWFIQGFGIKDDSLELKVLGTGITVGRKLAISVADTSFGIDFGRLFM